jgi:hypothetical protein
MNSLLCNTGLYSDVLNTPASYVLILLAVVNYAIVLAVVVRHRFNERRPPPPPPMATTGHSNTMFEEMV